MSEAAITYEDDDEALHAYERPALSGTHNITPSASLMAAMLAHEIKNPLAGIRGAAQLLGQHADAQDKPLTELITREVDRINQLLQRIEFFSNQPIACDQAVNVHEVLQYVRDVAATSFAPNVTITSHYDPSLPEVRGDRELLIQLFMNLIQNAAEAIGDKEDGTIAIGTHYQINHTFRIDKQSGSELALPVAITIEDNGGGIPEKILNSLFDPFVSSKKDGKGLGLAIVAKIVGEHGGMISLDPTDTQGTRFKVMLPIYAG